MILRNGKNYNEFIIDFEDASNEWRKNKIYVGNGCFIYKI